MITRLQSGNVPGTLALAGVAGVACFSMAIILKTLLPKKGYKEPWIPSPRKAVHEQLTPAEIERLPYPPDILPGARDVETPYGSIKVFEWGPQTGERVLLLPGIGTPVLALGDLAEELVSSGYRVLLFDFFGRGYSDAVVDMPYDIRLYTTQILLVLASSSICWTGDNGFHLVGYSLGGGIAVAFGLYFPHMVRSLTLVAGGGLIRRPHISWRSKILYSTGILPEWLLERLVRARLTPRETPTTEETVAAEVVEMEPMKREEDPDVKGGESWDNTLLSRKRPDFTVSAVMAWQLRTHPGFVKAFMSSIRYAPIYEQQEDWKRLGSLLAQRRGGGSHPPGLIGGKVLLVLGASDSVVLKEEAVPDAKAALGEEAVDVAIVEGGHEIAIVQGAEVAKAAVKFWTSCI